jgi:hypothetical protein
MSTSGCWLAGGVPLPDEAALAFAALMALDVEAVPAAEDCD